MLTKQQLKEFWSKDPTFIEKYHEEAGSGLDFCVDKSWDDFTNASVKLDIFMYDDKPIGFYGKEKSFIGDALSGFYILPEYRNKEVISKFWNEVLSNFPSFFWVGMGKNNIPAHKFIEKNNGRRAMEDDKGVFYFIEKGN